MRILICDDTIAPLTAMKEPIAQLAPGGSTVDILTGTEVSGAARSLEERRRAASGKHSESPPAWGSHPFDGVDLLFIDYNFIELESAGGLTGSRLAYLARCYSDCKFIVVLNQFGRNRFDLTLRDHPETPANLHLGSDQIGNPGLWGSKDWPEFRPWIWPILPEAVARLERITAEISGALDVKILEFLDLSDRVSVLPRTVRQFLVRDDMTFGKLVIEAENGLDNPDRFFNDSVIARFAASQVSKWLDHLVLAAQDLLIDVPRLLSRYPSLLRNRTFESLHGQPLTPDFVETLELPVYLGEHQFKKADWLPRAAWFRHSLLSDERIQENAETAAPGYELRFAEDASRFIAKEEAASFVADLSSPFVQRFVRKNRGESVEYQPQLRFAL